MPRPSTLGRLGEVAEDQWGLVTRRQAEEIAGIPASTFARMAADGSALERVAHGVYRVAGAPIPDHLELRAAWLQLAPETPAWDRTPEQGVASHRSAAALYGAGHPPADRHDFTLPARRQSRRPDVRLHQRLVGVTEWVHQQGLPVTRPNRIASQGPPARTPNRSQRRSGWADAPCGERSCRRSEWSATDTDGVPRARGVARRCGSLGALLGY
jgi:hypothetical protein